MLRNSQDTSAQETVEKKETATETTQPVNLFALMGGMAQSMEGIAKKTESEKFKADMEKDPIGSMFALMFGLLGDMAQNVEKAANTAEKSEPAKEVVTAPASPSVTKVGLYNSPVTSSSPSPFSSPEFDRKADSSPSTPKM